MIVPTRINTGKYRLTEGSLECRHCNSKAPMYVVCSGEAEEVYITGPNADLLEWCADHKWQVLLCAACQRINVFQFSKWESDYVVAGTDEHGDDIYRIPTTTYVLYPDIEVSIPSPHPNMSNTIREDYQEAKRIFNLSSRSAAALLRLALQKLCAELGEKGRDINYDIAELVKKGLPTHIQQALDIVRVVGNEAVHPGQIDIRDNPEIAKELFNLINEIVEDRIGMAQKQTRISKIYNSLPESKLKGISERGRPKP